MAKLADLGSAGPDHAIFSEPWTVRPMPVRPREEGDKPEDKGPTEQGSSEGSEDGGPHSLRHTYASLLLQSGAPPQYVSRQMGHASIKITVDTYGRWLPMRDNAGESDGLDLLHGSNPGQGGLTRRATGWACGS